MLLTQFEYIVTSHVINTIKKTVVSFFKLHEEHAKKNGSILFGKVWVGGHDFFVLVMILPSKLMLHHYFFPNLFNSC